MNLNPELIAQIEEDGLNKTEALLYCFALHYNLDMQVFMDKIIDEETEVFYRINLTDRDIESNTYKLKIPLFLSEDYTDKFLDLITALKQNGFTSNGHPNNQIKYSVIDTNDTTKHAFNRFYHNDIDLTRLINCIVSYYSRTEMPVKLSKFFDTIASIEYDSYTQSDNFL